MLIKGGFIMKKIWSLLLISALILGLFGCNDIQDNYTEVYFIEKDGLIFRYVMPGDGEAAISRNRMNIVDTEFIYIYNANDFDSFSYENFFSPLGEFQIHEDSQTGKFYILNNDDIDQLIYLHSLDYDSWKASQGS